MDALQMLRDDHRKVKDMFRQFEEAEDRATKKGIVDAVLVELEIHSTLEEEIFYPAVRRQGETGEIVDHAEEEHHAAEMLMNELSRMDAGDDAYESKFSVLADVVKEHIDDEESQILPKAAEVGMALLERLGEQMEERRKALFALMRSRYTRSQAAKSAAGATSRSTSTGSTKTKATVGSKARSSNGSLAKANGSRPAATNGSRAKAASATRAKTSASSSAQKATPAAARSGGSATVTKTRSKLAGRRSGSKSNAS